MEREIPMPTGRWRVQIAITTATLLAACWLVAPGPTRAGTPDVASDFDGNGHSDLAVGVPDEDFGGHEDAGGVHVIYGTFDGLDGDEPVDDQFWTQDSSGVQESAEDGDRFGVALATGDFDGDGYDDLAIGVPFEDVPTASGEVGDAGAVHVLYGSPTGLTASGDDLWTQDSSGVLDEVESGDRFGFALEAADFGNGSAEDLAIGVPLENVGSLANAGAVHVLYGGGSGLTTTGDQVWHQNSTSISGVAEGDDRFGSSLAAGDMGRSGHADLAIGVPLENTAGVSNVGAVHVLYGTSSGLSGAGDQLWTEDSSGVRGVSQKNDQFGDALVAADFGKGSRADLAIGSPREDIGGTDEGVVHVLYGGDTGLTADGNQLWHQDVSGIAGEAEDGDLLGASLAAADFGRESQADLAIGVPGETKEQVGFDDEETGAVTVIYGTPNGLTASGDQFWWQDSSGIEGETESFDHFGTAVAAGGYGKGSRADLAVGVPSESDEDLTDQDFSLGAVNVIYGTTDGLSSAGDQFWWQRSDTLGDSGDDFDHFGSSLAD